MVIGDVVGEGIIGLGLGVVASPEEDDGGGGIVEGLSGGGSIGEGKGDGGLYGGVLELW